MEDVRGTAKRCYHFVQLYRAGLDGFARGTAAAPVCMHTVDVLTHSVPTQQLVMRSHRRPITPAVLLNMRERGVAMSPAAVGTA